MVMKNCFDVSINMYCMLQSVHWRPKCFFCSFLNEHDKNDSIVHAFENSQDNLEFANFIERTLHVFGNIKCNLIEVCSSCFWNYPCHFEWQLCPYCQPFVSQPWLVFLFACLGFYLANRGGGKKEKTQKGVTYFVNMSHNVPVKPTSLVASRLKIAKQAMKLHANEKPHETVIQNPFWALKWIPVFFAMLLC